MPKMYLEFDLDKESEAADLARYAGKLHSSICVIRGVVRAVKKYDKPVQDALDEIEDELFELATELPSDML